MRHITLAAILLGACILGLPTAASGVGNDHPTGISPLTSPGTDLDDLAQRLDAVGSSEYGSVYGGLTEDAAASQITVRLTALTPAVEQAFTALAPSPNLVTFAQTPRNLRDLHTTHDQVTAAADSLRSQGVDIRMWWPEVRSGRESIEVVGLTTDERQALESEFGADAVSVTGIDPSQAPTTTANRTHDSTPHNGGTSTYSYGQEGCSSAFPVDFGGTAAMLSASHCYDQASNGLNVWNYIDVSGLDGSGLHIGDFAAREVGGGAGDTGVYTTNGVGGSSHSIWTGTIGNASLTTVAGKFTSVVDGTSVCDDGSYSGQVCGIKVVDTDVCVVYSDFRDVCHLDSANTQDKCSDTCLANQAGYSGGPVIKFDGTGNVLAVGIVSGQQGNIQVPCQDNKTTCYASLLFVPINHALNWSNATLKTG